MSKLVTKWRSQALNQEVMVARWGTVGRPVLLFPTAGGDAEECERFLMLKVLAPLLEAGKIKIYSCDSVAGRAWIDGDKPGAYKARVQKQFDVFIHRELVPAEAPPHHPPTARAQHSAPPLPTVPDWRHQPARSRPAFR